MGISYIFLLEMSLFGKQLFMGTHGRDFFCGGCPLMGIAPLWEVPATEMCIGTELPLYRRS